MQGCNLQGGCAPQAGGGGGGSGTVTNVATGTGLTGGPITTTGTIDLDNTAVTPGAYTSADITVDAQGRITTAASGTGGSTLYTADDTIGAGRIATLTDTLELSGGRVLYNGAAETSILNGTSVVEVKQASDLPASLAANTTYLIRGSITFSTAITVTVSGCAIVGEDRNKDQLIWDGLTGTTGITVTDVDFELRNLYLSSNNTGSVVLSAVNFLLGAFNNGRTKVFSIFDCQFRGCYDVASFEGFDLIDIANTLFWYIKAPNHGLKFENTSKIEISSCEFIRWFDETTISPGPVSGYATCPMIELMPNGAGPGFGAVNINGSIFHPQVTQDGIKINPLSTTGFGTVAANTFVDVNLGSGLKFFPDPSAGGYSTAECLKYDISVNQGLPNSSAYGMGYTTTTVAAIADAAYTLLPVTPNFQTASQQRVTIGTDGQYTYLGTKPIYAIITAAIAVIGNTSTDDLDLAIFLNGAILTGSTQRYRPKQNGDATVVPLVFSTPLVQNDVIAIYGQISGAGNWDLTNMQISLREN